jgi:phage gp36-like protein
MAGLNYTSNSLMATILPLVGSIQNFSSQQLCHFGRVAEAEVNGKLAKLYAVPVPGEPPLLAAIATDIALYRVLSQRVFTQERLQESEWPDKFKEARELLDEIASGAISIVNSADEIISTSNASASQVWSNTKDHHVTKTELPPELEIQDEDKIEDLLDERDISTLGDKLV